VAISSPKRLSGLLLVSALVVAACGGSGATAEPTAAPTDGASAPAESPSGGGTVSGSIFVTGSSTVEPISAGVAELFKDQNPDFDFTVEGPGTGDGFAKFCNGEADISDASRPIRDSEAADCAANNIEYVELKVAIDGMAVLTSVNNDAVSCLSFADIYALVGPESTGFNNWADAATIAGELGSSTSFPDAPLTVTAPGEESGTFDSFVELAIADIAEERAQDETTRADYTASANDNTIIEGISGNDTSLGWVGFAFAEENLDVVRLISVAAEADGTCVEATPETIATNEYPLARDLFIYVNKAKAEENPAVAAYIDFYMADGTIAEVLEVVPYVNLTDEALAESRAAWEGR
jgi:phosphate transport system substrate-binding protein